MPGFARFFFRVAKDIKEKLDELVFKSETKEFGSPRGEAPDIRHQYHSKDPNINLEKFLKNLVLDIGLEQDKISGKISDLEETYQSFGKRIKFNLKFWSKIK